MNPQIRKAGRHISVQIERWDEDMFELLKRIGSARSFNTGYAASRPHSPNISTDDELEILKHKQDLSVKHAKMAGKGTTLAAQKQHKGNNLPLMQSGLTTNDRNMDTEGEVEIKNRRQLFLLNLLEEQKSLEKKLKEKK